VNPHRLGGLLDERGRERRRRKKRRKEREGECVSTINGSEMSPKSLVPR
jgi:hypothetical protein